jgi:AcrR family transcriptional regulator
MLNDRLLDAALALFNEDGYEKTTMEGIARAAGASTKTIYSRYENKAALLTAVVRRVIDRTVANQARETGTDPAHVAPRAFLIGLGSKICMAIATTGTGLHRLAYAEGHRFPELAQFYTDAVGHGVALLRDALTAWQRKGALPHLPPLDIAATLLFSMLTDRVRIRCVIGRPLSKPEMEAHVTAAVDIFLRACGRSG